MRFETDRLLIRKFLQYDAKDLFEYLSDFETYIFEPGEPITLATAKKLAIERSKSNDFLALVLTTNNKVIGHLSFKRNKPANLRTYELGFIINKKYQRKGYGTEAVSGLFRYISKNTSIHRIIANCNPANTASWKLLEKVGMRREGYFMKNVFFTKDAENNPKWQNTYQYAILVEEIGNQ